MAIANASEGDRAAESPHVHMGISDVTYFDRGTHTVNNQIATQPFRTKSSVGRSEADKRVAWYQHPVLYESAAPIASVRSNLNAIASGLVARYGKDVDLRDTAVVPLAEAMVGDVRPRS